MSPLRFNCTRIWRFRNPFVNPVMKNSPGDRAGLFATIDHQIDFIALDHAVAGRRFLLQYAVFRFVFFNLCLISP